MLEYILKKIVDHPEDVEVREVTGSAVVILEVKVNVADKGKVIGREGKNINALRTLIRAAAAKEKKKVDITVLQ
jgi:predicted RNA-binding protein YlqC (UPF0109 family)